MAKTCRLQRSYFDASADHPIVRNSLPPSLPPRDVFFVIAGGPMSTRKQLGNPEQAPRGLPVILLPEDVLSIKDRRHTVAD